MNDTATGTPTDWTTEAIVARRDRFYAASQRKFVPYQTPLIFKRGQGQYLWDESDRRYVDLLGMNVCISVGHSHPRVVAAAREQMEQLTHCTTMFYHPVPAHFAEELTATLPAGHDWVVHFTSSGTEAIDLALLMARSHTRHIDMLSLRTSYHGATFGAQSLTGISGFRHDVPQLGGVSFVAEPNQYRGIFGAGTQPYLDEIDRVIATATTGKVAARKTTTRKAVTRKAATRKAVTKKAASKKAATKKATTKKKTTAGKVAAKKTTTRKATRSPSKEAPEQDRGGADDAASRAGPEDKQ